VPQKTLNRFVNTHRFDFKKLFTTLSLDLCRTKPIRKRLKNAPGKGVLIVDDSPLEKSGRHMQGISKLYHSSKQVFYHGYEMVAVAFTVSSVAFFLDFMLKPKSPKPFKKTSAKKSTTSKLTLAAQMIASALASGVAARFVTFDLWYTAVSFLKRMEDLHLIFVAPIKRNRLVLYQGKRRSAAYFIERCRNTREWGTLFPVELPQFGLVHLAVYKRRLKNKKSRIEILITNGLRLSSERIFSIYQKRWTIETLFREAKQSFQLEQFHNRNQHAIIAHLGFSLMAMMLIRAFKFFFKSLQSFTPGSIKKQLIRTKVKVEITLKRWTITFYEKNPFLQILKQLNPALREV
jgi:IS4 transposase